MRVFLLLLVVGLLVSGDSFAREALADEVQAIRIATLAPRQSPLGDEYQKLKVGLKNATDGKVTLQMYYGGVAGDESTVVRKMRVGQLDGALITSAGLGKLVRSVLVLQAPGMITTYQELDLVRTELGPRFVELFENAGYKLIAWGDAGRIRMFSQQKIRSPGDLRTARPWAWRDSPPMQAVLKASGANGVLLSLPEVYSGLQTGMIDTVIASSVAVMSFQWFTKLKTMAKQSSGIVVGAFIIKKDKFDALPEEAKQYFKTKVPSLDSKAVDDEATQKLSERLKVINLIPSASSWQAIQYQARWSLAGRLYSKALLEEVGEIVGRR
ncbi:MAG: TRAP transporter substrate-binding protein DctP [Polyangiales bacterium]